ncbi:SRPBCC domain-containing protein [Pseudalkalibacillus hwajinpoensis]|uniref:SRPBCC family protein n=1 Tax=Guptibacillus hwajinpoensis TaxID=208199 RepID=UPI00325AF1FF
MSDNKVKRSMKTNVEGRTLTMERIFDAPRDLVFKVFSDGERLASWWGPKGWETENRSFEFKPEGEWHYCMKCIDKNQGEWYGQESWGKAIYQEIVESEKIVYKDIFSDAEGNKVEGMPEMLISLTFLDEGDKTKLITKSEFTSVDALKQVMDMGVVEGFTSQNEKLDDYLNQLQ